MSESRNDKIAILTPREDDILNDQSYSIHTELNSDETKAYINNFITNTVSGKKLGYTDADSVIQRIHAISNLSKITKQPIMLMITMHVLPYLEAFYKETSQKNIEIPVLKKDLLHLFTSLVIADMSHAVTLQNDLLDHVGRLTVSDILFKYTSELAKVMNTPPGISTIKEEELLTNPHLKKFFPTDPSAYKNQEEYLLFSLGHHYGGFLRKQGETGHSRYTFLHPEFFDYFATLTPQSIRGRRSLIKDFIKNNSLDIQLSPQYVKSQTSLEEPIPTEGSVISGGLFSQTANNHHHSTQDKDTETKAIIPPSSPRPRESK